MYYKEKNENRIKVIKKKKKKAQKDSMRNGQLQETFLEAPNAKKEVTIKISLPVYK